METQSGKFKGYAIVRDAFGRIKVDDWSKLDPKFRELLEALRKAEETDHGSHSSDRNP